MNPINIQGSASSRLQTQPRQQTESYSNSDIFNKLLEKVKLNPSEFTEITKTLNEPYMDQILSWLLTKAESELSLQEKKSTANVENHQESQYQDIQPIQIQEELMDISINMTQEQNSITQIQNDFPQLNIVESGLWDLENISRSV